MVEPPGTAPGSDPLITSAFMSIVPKDSSYIGGKRQLAKGGQREILQEILLLSCAL